MTKFLGMLAIAAAIGASHAALSTAGTKMRLSCRLGHPGKTTLANIPASAVRFKFKFQGGGFNAWFWTTGPAWYNRSLVRNARLWMYTYQGGRTTTTGVTAIVRLRSGKTLHVGVADCY